MNGWPELVLGGGGKAGLTGNAEHAEGLEGLICLQNVSTCLTDIMFVHMHETPRVGRITRKCLRLREIRTNVNYLMSHERNKNLVGYIPTHRYL